MFSPLEQQSISEIRQGYRFDNALETYQCLVCGQSFAEGEIFPIQGRYLTAQRAVAEHVKEHGSRLEQLLEYDQRYTGFTQNQQTLLKLIGAGMSDNDIAKQLGLSPSTIRHQRFAFREKAKQAKMYLAIYSLAFENRAPNTELVAVHRNAKMVDERYIITQKEREHVLQTAFESLQPLKLRHFPVKEKKKLIILTTIAEQFQTNQKYTEGQINQTLEAIYSDYVTLRRYLIEYGFLDRTTDGSEYWLKA